MTVETQIDSFLEKYMPQNRWRPSRVALIEQAIRPHEQELRGAGPLQTIIKSVSAKQRPRRREDVR